MPKSGIQDQCGKHSPLVGAFSTHFHEILAQTLSIMYYTLKLLKTMESIKSYRTRLESE